MKKILFFLLFGLVAFNTQAAQPYFENDKLSLDIGLTMNNQMLACFNLKDGWHISYQNAGDAGVPTSFEFENMSADLLNQSAPEKFLYEDIITQYGYGKAACYLFAYSDISDNAAIRISWTACKDYCEPEEVEVLFSKLLEISPQNYQQALLTFPLPFKEKVFISQSGQDLILTTKAQLPDDTYFIPTQHVFNADAEQILRFEHGKSLLNIRTDGIDAIPQSGLFISQNGSYTFDITPKKPNLIFILLTAFCAGLLLNLMPCVFPVLSLKAIQMVNDSRFKKGSYFRALFYTLGVVASFLLIAGILYILKSTGAALGWGFQLQSPAFVVFMMILFGIILLQSLELIHFHLPFGAKIHKVSSLNSFLTGFFAVLIASPCTGPFMGAAVGYALFERAAVYFPVFLFLSLGYALPFAALEMFPFIVKKLLPKPGRWMRRVKYILSVPIVLTLIWLLWVLCYQIFDHTHTDAWSPYREDDIEAAIAQGDPVFIDFSAKWCLTCLVNEHTVLNSDEFLEFARRNDIKLFKADWTNKDSHIFEALKKYGRSSIPLYVFYAKDTPQYVILPTILTTDNVTSVISQTKN
ncbi:MAG: thioredoxin family protein [Alphaproteobacteria bacterium]|nr:thioredoxin family protein [Alphaproteobacteria bacterium]